MYELRVIAPDQVGGGSSVVFHSKRPSRPDRAMAVRLPVGSSPGYSSRRSMNPRSRRRRGRRPDDGRPVPGHQPSSREELAEGPPRLGRLAAERLELAVGLAPEVVRPSPSRSETPALQPERLVHLSSRRGFQDVHGRRMEARGGKASRRLRGPGLRPGRPAAASRPARGPTIGVPRSRVTRLSGGPHARTSGVTVPAREGIDVSSAVRIAFRPWDGEDPGP